MRRPYHLNLLPSPGFRDLLTLDTYTLQPVVVVSDNLQCAINFYSPTSGIRKPIAQLFADKDAPTSKTCSQYFSRLPTSEVPLLTEDIVTPRVYPSVSSSS